MSSENPAERNVLPIFAMSQKELNQKARYKLTPLMPPEKNFYFLAFASRRQDGLENRADPVQTVVWYRTTIFAEQIL